MDKKINNKLIITIITIFAITAFFGIISFALAQGQLKGIPATVEVISGIESIAVYTDSSLTEVLTELDFGGMTREETKSLNMFVFNNGQEDLNIVMETSDISSFGTVVFSPEMPSLLIPDRYTEFFVGLTIDSSTPNGIKNFNVYISNSN